MVGLNSIRLLKWPFLASFLINFSTICPHMLSKFIKKSAQKLLIFPIKASFERSLFFFLIFMFLLPMQAEGADAQVDAGINLDAGWEQQPIKGTITITHASEEKINPSSFQLGNHPIVPELVKTVKISPTSPLEVSIYSFTLPGQPPGLYVLPEVKVTVGSRTYQSISTTYEVKKANAQAPITPPPSSQQPAPKQTAASLQIQLRVEGPKPFYPGQRSKIIYLYIFRGNIELTKETLPLLEPKGFVKIGEKKIEDRMNGAFNEEEITQGIEAVSPGEFSFPSSQVEGYAYEENPILKKRTYLQPALKAEVAPLTLTVAPFPQADQPGSFSGAVGEFSLNASLLTPSKIRVDDRIKLSIEISGKENLWTVTLPDLQPLKGLFRIGNLPVIEENGHKKKFIVELFPLSPAVTEIPPLTFSYFNPTTAKYATLKSASIPITVLRREAEGVKETPIEKTGGQTEQHPFVSSGVIKPVPLSISPLMHLAPDDLASQWFRFSSQLSERLANAETHYQLGEKASTLSEQKTEFNAALSLYLHLEQENGAPSKTGKLEYNIANSFLQLNQYPEAIYYYYSALQQDPRNTQIRENLNDALKQNGLLFSSEESNLFEHILLIYPYLSYAERLQLTLLCLGGLAALAAYYYRHRSNSICRNGIVVLCSCLLFLAAGLGYSRYFSPIEGVVMHATFLSRAPTADAGAVEQDPLFPGIKVHILEVMEDGQWVKVLDPKQRLGYLPAQQVRAF